VFATFSQSPAMRHRSVKLTVTRKNRGRGRVWEGSLCHTQVSAPHPQEASGVPGTQSVAPTSQDYKTLCRVPAARRSGAIRGRGLAAG